MVKLTVITDAQGKVLGAVRANPAQSGNVTVQFRAHPSHKIHQMEVADELMRKPAEELHRELSAKIAGTR